MGCSCQLHVALYRRIVVIGCERKHRIFFFFLDLDKKSNQMQESIDWRSFHTTALMLLGYFSRYLKDTEYQYPTQLIPIA